MRQMCPSMAAQDKVSSIKSMASAKSKLPYNGWRERIREIIFEADIQAGKAADVGLIVAIVVSLAASSRATRRSRLSNAF